MGVAGSRTPQNFLCSPASSRARSENSSGDDVSRNHRKNRRLCNLEVVFDNFMVDDNQTGVSGGFQAGSLGNAMDCRSSMCSASPEIEDIA
ncbi:hypothetical protein JTB14_024185 [Gonioctena quinquepunctata]|nr:hypothetical protein JTB14_024185 [Gonioctena quinquepunctata]